LAADKYGDTGKAAYKRTTEELGKFLTSLKLIGKAPARN